LFLVEMCVCVCVCLQFTDKLQAFVIGRLTLNQHTWPHVLNGTQASPFQWYFPVITKISVDPVAKLHCGQQALQNETTLRKFGRLFLNASNCDFR